MINIGDLSAAGREFDRALHWFHQAAAIMKEVGDQRVFAIICWNLGLVYEKLGLYANAIESMEVSVTYQRMIGHPQAETQAAYVDELRRKLLDELGG